MINIIAIIFSPIVAVVIGQKLQERKELRDDRMKIFKTLMTSRIYPWTNEMVNALNSIDIVFADDKKVRQAWKELFDKYNVSVADDFDCKKIQNAQYRLLEKMAQSLGYKEKITWETIQNPYIPRGLQNQIDVQNKNQQMYSEIMAGIKENIITNTK